MSGRGRPRSFDRAAALRCAMDVFWAKGFDGASISDLTTAMGINSPSLYAAFGSKEALFREAVDLYGATEGTENWRALPTAPTAREAIRRFLEATAVAYTTPGRPQGCLIVLGALHANDGSLNVCRDLKEHRLGNLEALRERLERGVAEGDLPEGTDCRAMATFYATLQHGMSIQAHDGATRDSLLSIARCAMTAWDSLVLPKRSDEMDGSPPLRHLT